MSPQLLASITAICYAVALVSSRLGLKYSTPDTVTLVSILVQNVTLWSAVYLTGGIPRVSGIAVGIFCIVGTFQMGVRLLAYTGVLKIGTSRSGSLQSIGPLFSAAIAISILDEAGYHADYRRHVSGGRRRRAGFLEGGTGSARAFAGGTCCCPSAPPA